jgi:hypothetical protein
MSATTFQCPHCQATYPLKPVLVGKVVRCTSCKNPFRLGPDGVAVKVDGTAAIPAKPQVPAPPAKAAADPQPPTRRQSERIALSGKQVDQRKAMADSLSTAMGDALRAEAAAQTADGAQAGKPPTDRKARSARLGAEGGKRKPGPAALTGEGEREAANLRQWALGAVAVVALLGLLGWLLTYDGPRRQALDDFTAVVPAQDNFYGRRAEAIVARAWPTAAYPGAPGVAPFIDLPKARLGRVQSAPGTALADARDRIKDLTWIDPPGLWVNLAADGRRIAAAAPGREAFLREAARSKLIVLDPAGLRRALVSNGRDELVAQVAVAVVAGERTAGRSDLGALLAAKPPERVECCTFEGASGLVLIDTGSGYQTRERPFRGVMVRFIGEGWPQGWRVLELEATAP